MQKTLIAILALASAIATARGEDTTSFSYTHGMTTDWIGFGKSETCDIAIFIPGAPLEGCRITGLKVPVADASAITATSGWLSTELKLKRDNGKYVTDPDICMADASITDGYLNVVFDEPYTITSNGLYAGYTYTQSNAEYNGIAVSKATQQDGLWLHTSRSKMKWSDMSAELSAVSQIQVMIDGELGENAASIVMNALPTVPIDNEVKTEVTIMNFGLHPINSIKYTYTTPDGTGADVAELTTPIPALPGSTATVGLTLGHLTQTGKTDISVKVTEVNNQPNTCIAPTTEFPIKAIPFMPVNRPLFEEYTGLWCGWCPRGFVALEAMKSLHPDRFIGVAYHQGDAMSFLKTKPGSTGGGLPTSYLNRSYQLNPGTVYDIWDEFASSIPSADLDTEISWSDGECSDIIIQTSARFIEDAENADYRLSYLLVADGLYNDKWSQNNSYSGLDPAKYPDMPSPWSDVFFNGESLVKGLTFDDVVIAASDYNGIGGSLPANIIAGESYSHTFRFAIDDLTASKATDIINDLGKLRAIAVITNERNGTFVNCAKSAHIDGTTRLQDINPADIKTTDWYDLTGNKVSSTHKGVLIRIDTYTDGTRKSSKCIN